MKSKLLWILQLGALAWPGPGAASTNGAVAPRQLMIDDMESKSRVRAVSERAEPRTKNQAAPGLLVIDDMEASLAGTRGPSPQNLGSPARFDAESEAEPRDTNSLGAKAGTYQQEPSQIDAIKSPEFGKEGAGLRIYYYKKNKGGPRGDGGFCGYYSLLHAGDADFRDLSGFRFVVFWVKGLKGGENFKVGVADKTWAQRDDTVKSKEVGKYLEAGKITTEWQLAVIPMAEFRVDWSQAHSIAICFEADLYQNGAGRGVVFIDELAVAKESPLPRKQDGEEPKGPRGTKNPEKRPGAMRSRPLDVAWARSYLTEVRRLPASTLKKGESQ